MPEPHVTPQPDGGRTRPADRSRRARASVRPAGLGGLVVACWLVAVAGGPAAVAVADPVASGDVLLLDFAASWCGPCRQMAPLVAEIEAAGWPVRHVDVDREHDLVRRFGVTGVPCYVLVVKGREAGRIDGATTRGDLERLLAQAAPQSGGAPAGVPAPPPAGGGLPGIPLPTQPPPAPLVTEPSPAAAGDPDAGLDRRVMQATARLRVGDADGASWGTGTVIDCRQGEALILTCGHIFRDSQGKGRIEVDLFAPGSPRGVAGQVVSWDLRRDLALVSVFTDASIEAARVGGTEQRTRPGDAVLTVGCDGGADPTIHRSRVTAVDKYLGAANIQVAGQPVQGRSGGGLFAADGTLIGVCNAADPEDNEGLFAALPAIHEQLEEAGLAFVYRNVYPSGGLAGGPVTGPPLPAMPREMPPVSLDRRDRADALPTASPIAAAVPPAGPLPAAAAVGASESRAPIPFAASPAAAATAPATTPLTSGETALIDHVRGHGGRAEVICIVRPHGAAEASSEVFVLPGSSREFVDRLARAHEAAAEGEAPPGVSVRR
jgi:thiol-disulfide isomerase/thioredoxin